MAAKKPITNKKSFSQSTKHSQTKTIKVRRKSAVIFRSRLSIFDTFQETLGNFSQALAKKVHSFNPGFKQLRLRLDAKTAQKKKIFFTAYHKKINEIAAHRKAEALKQKQLKSQKLVAKKNKQKEKQRKLVDERKRTVAFARRLPNPVRFIYLEIIHPFIYVFRHHPLISFGSILFSVLILLSSYVVYDLAFKDLPSVTELTGRKQILTTKILDRNGNLLYSIYKDENRTLIPLSQVPLHMQQATIAIEDKDFYSHHGFSFRGIVRAINSDIKGEQLQGGSTITQQLVKNTLLSPEKTFKRKVRELLLSFMMEGTYSKDEILEMYFNEIPYGGSTYGVEEAAQRYFGKSAHQLTLAESAFLAGLPAAPSVYSPFGATPEYAYMRQREVLRRMVEDGYITDEQATAAKNEVLTFQADSTNIKAPHFVMYVRNLLAQEYGEEVLNQGGLEVRTTLDLDTQNQSQKIVTDEMVTLARLRINNGAAMVTNPQTGEILAMVGSKNYFDFKHDGQVNVTLRPRQPGSSIKPLTYALAFEQGKNPSTTILDEPISFSSPGSPPYVPKNYDGKFHGNVTMRQALASSYNIPAVKTLASVGINTMIDKGEDIGITTWGDRKRFGLALTLGSGEVMMADMTKLYGTFATYGNTIDLNPILEVKNSHGETMYHNTCALDHQNCPSQRNFSSKTSYQITSVLSDNNARTPAFGPRSVLNIPGQQVAVKTGTTNNLHDNWTIGYTTDRVVAVWVGNNDNQAMSYVASGITGASPIWNKIMRTQLDDAHPHVFPTPDGLVTVKICAKTGTLPCKGCPSVVDELYTPGTEPTQACNPAQFIPASPAPNPSGTPQPRGKILDGFMMIR
jgi:1A family penicillin-binding protein